MNAAPLPASSSPPPRPAASTSQPAASPPPSPVRIDGVAFDAVSADQLVQCIVDSMRERIGGVVATINTDHLREYRHNQDFRDVTHEATHRIADGMPIVWLSLLLQTPLPERVAGADLIEDICAAIAPQNASIAIIGGPQGVGRRAARLLVRRNRGLELAMVHAPPPGFETDTWEMAALRSELRAKQPDFVFIALGMPKQELLISQLRHEAPTAWWMGVGAGIEFLAGTQERAPELLQKTGFEWLHRLVEDPKRMAGRYLLRDVPYLAAATCRSLRQRFLPSKREH